MNKWYGCFGILVVMGYVCGNAWAIVRQPANSVEGFEVERAYRQHSEQPANAPAAAPIPDVKNQNQQDNTHSVMQVERANNPQDVKALRTAQHNIRMQDPWYRALRLVGGSLLVLGIGIFVIWRLWTRIALAQRKKMLEEMQRGQQLAKELRDKQ